MHVQQLCRLLTAPPQYVTVAGIEVRPFKDKRDIAGWIDLMRDAFVAADPPMRPWTTADFEKHFVVHADHSPDKIFLAYDGEHRLVGSVALRVRSGRDRQHIPAIHWLAVRPAWRRRGIARLLVAHLESVCWRRGMREIHLETHAGWREAVRFYEAVGYLPTHQVTERPSMRTSPD